MPLTIQTQVQGATFSIVLTGTLDEYAELHKVDLQGCEALTLDMGGVVRCNSMGVMRWMHFLRAIPKAAEVRLENCSTAMVKQFNLYPAFLGHPRLVVASFQTPYVCPSCEKNRTVLAHTVAGAATVKLPTEMCECGKQMELDGWPEKQFLFLNRHQSRPDGEE